MPFTLLLNKPENVSVDGIVTRHADDLTADNLEHAHPFFPGKMEKKDFINRPVKKSVKDMSDTQFNLK